MIRLGTGGVAAAFVSGAADLASEMLADMIRFRVADVPWLSTRILATNGRLVNPELVSVKLQLVVLSDKLKFVGHDILLV